MRHIHADMIKEWVEDTNIPVQCKLGKNGIWEDCNPNFNPNWDYRFKCDVLRYKRYLCKLQKHWFIEICYEYSKPSDHFVRWIDTEWQECEKDVSSKGLKSNTTFCHEILYY